MSKKDWWRSMFDQKYLDTYIEGLTDSRTKNETDFLLTNSGIEKSDRILDLACGHGRHSIELFSRGYRNITGLDYSQTFIDKALIDATDVGAEIDFQEADMKQMNYDSEFDVVVTIYTTLGYFDDETNRDVLRRIYKSLKPGGKFWMDNIRAESVATRFKTDGVIDGESGLPTITREVDMSGHMTSEIETYDSHKQLMHSHRQWTDKGDQKEYDFWLRVYTEEQWAEMLQKAGFKILKKWSDYDGIPFDTKESHGFVLLAKKV
jgi:ubiquinone/menaquinone biosynthesis C-methylase UbiE